MYIDLKWANSNAGPVTTKVYRGTVALDRANLINPIATLTNNELSYRDTTVVFGVTYYYVIEFTANGISSSTKNFVTTATYVRGHGAATTVLGDEVYGFMDYITIGRSPAIFNALGLTSSIITDVNFGPGIKCIINNKVYFSMVLTSNTVGTTLATLTPLFNNNAGIQIEVEGFKYIVRLAKALGPSWDGTTKVATSEVDPLFAKLVQSQFISMSVTADEKLGKLNTLLTTNPVIGREMVASTVATRMVASAAITWSALTTSTTSAIYAPFILELVD